MKCSTLIGTLSSTPTTYGEVDGEELVKSSLSIKGKEYGLSGYASIFTEEVGTRVRAIGHVSTSREMGRLKTSFRVLKLEKASDDEKDDSSMKVEGTLVKRDNELTVLEGRGVQLIAGVLQFKDGEDQYNLVHFACKGKQAREMLAMETGINLELSGLFIRKSSVYELRVKEIEKL